jgi:flagellar hook-basal body complex protein FliE
MITAMAAAKLYATTQSQLTPKTPGVAGNEEGAGFADLVKSAVNDAVQTSRHAEKQMIGQAQGKVELVDAVTAITSAQASLQTVMAVRDQVISAYQQIMQMPI